MKLLNKKVYEDFIIYNLLSSNKKYNVFYLDKVYLCECAIMYNRNIKKDCKHIKFIKDLRYTELLKENDKR